MQPVQFRYSSAMYRISRTQFFLISCLVLLQLEAFNVQRIRLRPMGLAVRISIRQPSATSLFMVSQTIESKQRKLNELESEIVSLGRRGATEDAIERYESIENPNIRILNAAIDACARAIPTRLDLAFELLDQGIKTKGLTPNVFTFGAIMSACNRARRADRAVKLLRTMQSEYGVKPNAIVYSSAISALGRTNPPDYRHALSLLNECTVQEKMPMSVVGYNAALSACAQAGQWRPAIELLERMEEAGLPDAITYGTVLSACERGEQWDLILKYAEKMKEKGLLLDGISATATLHACQQMGLADEAVKYLDLMKVSLQNVERKTAGWQRSGVRSPLKGPDAVAYNLAISACARGGKWERGIELLQEMQSESVAVDVVSYTSAITGLERAGEWRRAFALLEDMRKQGVEPNEVTMAAVIGACATALAKSRDSEQDKDDLPKRKALQLLRIMQNDPSVVKPTIIVYNAAIRTCAEALDVERAFDLAKDLVIIEGLKPTIYTYGSLVTACERVGSIDGVSKVFSMMREANIAPNEIIFGAAISTCRKSGDPERAMLLLRKMLRDGLEPNVATMNTVIIAQLEGRKQSDMNRAILAFKLMRASSKAQPNRQTYHLLIRGLADRLQPEGAEALLRVMQQAGFTPDVDLYTTTVAAYERTRQPLKALRLMESMESDGYDFYAVKVLNTAFKKAIKLVNQVVRGEDRRDDWQGKFDDTGDTDEFINGRRIDPLSF